MIHKREQFGIITCVDGTDQDVTQRKEAEVERDRLMEQIRQTQKMEAIGRLAGGVAHDFNNLLTVINGYSELMIARNSSQDPSQEFLIAIKEAGERATRLTSHLLAFSRNAIVEPRVIDLNVAVDSTANMLRRLIGEDIQLSVHLDPTCHPIKADHGQLEQILLNLAVNARDAMPKGGTINITTCNFDTDTKITNEWCECQAGTYSQLSVSHHGTGISPEVRARIFEPFYTTKDVGRGSGLGLATVYGIVRQADGYIDVETSHRGTTFNIWFPAATGMIDEKPVINSMPPFLVKQHVKVSVEETN